MQMKSWNVSANLVICSETRNIPSVTFLRKQSKHLDQVTLLKHYVNVFCLFDVYSTYWLLPTVQLSFLFIIVCSLKTFDTRLLGNDDA